jgi:DNA-binding GntR family transcriptional regulator
LSPKTNEELAFERLRRVIINGELPIGEFLSQRKLADIAGVAVVTVRTTLRALERDGLIENVPRWGVRIPQETEETITDRYFLRELLEVVAVRRFVERATARDVQALRELAAECDSLSIDGRPEDRAEYARVHFDLHQHVVECCGSPLLVETLDRVFLKSNLLYNARSQWVPDAAFTVSHRGLVEDIVSGDLELAEQSTRRHIALGLQFELQALRTQSAAQVASIADSTGLNARERND